MSSLAEAEILRLSDLNLFEFHRETTRWCGGELSERDGLLLAAADVDFPVGWHNGAITLREGVEAQRVLDVAREFYAPRNRGYTVWQRLHADPALAEAAEAAGLHKLYEMPGMAIEQPVPDPSPADGIELRVAGDAKAFADLREVSAAAYVGLGLPAEVTQASFSPEAMAGPHTAAAIAYADGAPVSGAMLYMSHGIGGLYWVGTKPEHNRKGLGLACTQAVTNEGFRRGARFVSLQASHQGHPIYERMGYREVTRYAWLVAPPPEPAAE